MAKRILIVDDDPDMVEIIRLVVEEAGYETSGAHDGPDSLRKLKSEHPDLVLLDIMMPGMDGWDILHHMKRDPSIKDTPVIVVTARTQTVDKMIGLHVARVQDYVTKPFGNRELIQRIEGVVGKP